MSNKLASVVIVTVVIVATIATFIVDNRMQGTRNAAWNAADQLHQLTNNKAFNGPATQVSEELTVYPVLCQGNATSLGNCKVIEAEGRTAYKIDAATQQVTSWSPDSPSQGYTQLKNCAVADANNWNCHYPDGSGTFGVTNNSYFNNSDSLNNGASTIYVSEAQWLANGGHE